MTIIAAIDGVQLRKALAEVEMAEKAGFIASQAVFNLSPENEIWHNGTFADVCEKAHPTDGRLNWGRDNFLVKRGVTFSRGKLVHPPPQAHKFVLCEKRGCGVSKNHCAKCGEPKKAGHHSRVAPKKKVRT